MSQNYSTNCYDVTHTVDMDMAQVESNDEALRTNHSGGTAPSNPVDYMFWADTANTLLKIRYSSAWYSIWDYANDMVATGKVKTASLASGILTADATGRAKMADLFITDAKVNDVSGSKLTDNTVSASKIQNNACTPSKLSAGTGTLICWHCEQISGGSVEVPAPDQGMTLASLTDSWITALKFFCLIPTGAKYIYLSARGQGAGGNILYVRANVNGTTGATASIASGAVNNANSAALDISGQDGAFRQVSIECCASAGSNDHFLVSVVVQWGGA